MEGRTGNGDAAMGLFQSPTDVHQPVDPKELTRLEHKIDFMVLSYLAVCYAFIYIDKATLSYAAIFDIERERKLARIHRLC